MHIDCKKAGCCILLNFGFVFFLTDIQKIMETERHLDGATLKFSNPPVCNSILITGLSRNTTKDIITMYLENKSGGKIYGDVIYQKDTGKAAVSFCDPQGKVKYIILLFIALYSSILIREKSTHNYFGAEKINLTFIICKI